MPNLAGAPIVAVLSLGLALLVATTQSWAQIASQTPSGSTATVPVALTTPSATTNLVATPQPPALATGCGKSGPAVHGGETTGLGGRDGSLDVTLPGDGLYFTLPGPSLTEPGLFVCSVDHDASVIISAVTGKEVSRTAHDAAGNAVLDQIVASVRLTGSPGAFAPPSVAPPITGDAGLKTGKP
jgi:hypothetical protein